VTIKSTAVPGAPTMVTGEPARTASRTCHRVPIR
jgi:hypothetical protein